MSIISVLTVYKRPKNSCYSVGSSKFRRKPTNRIIIYYRYVGSKNASSVPGFLKSTLNQIKKYFKMNRLRVDIAKVSQIIKVVEELIILCWNYLQLAIIKEFSVYLKSISLNQNVVSRYSYFNRIRNNFFLNREMV